ncbi:MAG: MBL fold metallo-hydrolase, partial [Actinomycetota bacterium]|nr:MBL fold metallo-hydrolase [Actinomycetota bacterium]
MDTFAVGELQVTALSDGLVRLPPEYFPAADWTAHQDLFDEDGTIHGPIGCFLVRTGDQTVLVDAGLGDLDIGGFMVGGALPAELAAAGVTPADIDLVVCTHLHIDHAGWLVADGEPYFANATVRFGRGDWAQLVEDVAPDNSIRVAMERLASLDRIDPIDGDGVNLAPGITSRAAPGHTHGHAVLVLSSGDDRAVLLGDAVTCPVQLTEPDWQGISDVDPDLAARTREALWRELEGTSTRAVGAHFPGLGFG